MSLYRLISTLALFLSLVVSVYGVIFFQRTIKRITGNDQGVRRTGRRLLLAYIVLASLVTVLGTSAYLFKDPELILNAISVLALSPFSLARDVVPVLLAIWLLRLGYPRALSTAGLIPDLGSEETLRKWVRQIFDSKHFINALNDALPKGEDDKKYGLDYIPFMLHSIRERRRRFAHSSQLFLGASILLGFVFASVVMYFGYILVNEAATGTSRTLGRLEGEASQIHDDLSLLLPGLSSNETFQRTARLALAKLSRFERSDSVKSIQERVDSSIIQATNARDLPGVLAVLDKALAQLPATVQTAEYRGALEQSREDLANYLATAESVVPRLNERIRTLDALISSARSNLDKPENRTAEIIKRIALGIVVSSFFLALLRYVAGLYRSHYMEVIRADEEDLAVRRFYVALKSTAGRPQDRRGIIESFLAGSVPKVATVAVEPPGETSISLSKEEAGILKEFVNALAKKF